eukprot:scaffold57012_cov63-Cyclotella_meneghiniana.AAC.1
MDEANTHLLDEDIDDLELESEPEPGNGKKNAVSNSSSVQSSKQHYSWFIPFCINIFLSCASFSIIQPSLAPYLLQTGIPESFLPWVLFSYSIGGMIGAPAVGLLYQYASQMFEMEGRGAKICLLGTWKGGQQTVEQAYLSVAVEPSFKVEYTATLGTCAVLGAMTGPCIGVLLSQIDTSIYGLPINADNAPGFMILVATFISFVQTLLFFDGKGGQFGREESSFNSVNEETAFNTDAIQNVPKHKESASTLDTEETNSSEEYHSSDSEEIFKVQEDEEICNNDSSLDTDGQSVNSNNEKPIFNTTGVFMSIYIYTGFHYCFAVQETITTPLVIKLYDWSPAQINLLFAGAGFLSLITCFSVRYISRRVKDQTLLIASIVIGLLGSAFQMSILVLPVIRFIFGFSLATIAFSFGRNVVMGMYSNILGPSSQGKWIGVIFAVSGIPRALAPFLAWEAVELVHWRTWLEFGLCSLFFLTALVGSIITIDVLVPYSEFVEIRVESGDESIASDFHDFSTISSRQNSPLNTPLLDNDHVCIT